MRFFNITLGETLSSLGAKVGSRNVSAVLNANSLIREPNIGKQLQVLQSNLMSGPSITKERKASILNTMTMDFDVFEKAALASDKEWRVISGTGSFAGALKIPESVTMANSVNMLGNDAIVPKAIYDKAIKSLLLEGRVNPEIFNDYSTRRASQVADIVQQSNPIDWFLLPWGQVTLFSSLGNDTIDFPCYPDDFDAGVEANYDTMPDMLYQYEPWYVYKSSSAPSNTYTFKIHRDMWSGDHRDGMCNKLIRFCEANCYPDFKGAAVNTATVIFYIGGREHIRGIMTSVKKTWSGPIGLDDFPLVCDLSITIAQVAEHPLNYSRVRNLELG